MPDTLDLQSLTELCAKVIGVPSVVPEDNFFDAGGDSVSAARLVILLRQRWNLNTDIGMVIAADTLADIHQGLRSDIARELR